MIIWFRPLRVDLRKLSVQWCCGSSHRYRTDRQMWTDRPTDPWLIVHLSAPAAESLGRSTVLCCSSIFPPLISHASALSSPRLSYLLFPKERVCHSANRCLFNVWHREKSLFIAWFPIPFLWSNLSCHFLFALFIYVFFLLFIFPLIFSAVLSSSVLPASLSVPFVSFYPCESLFQSPFSHPSSPSFSPTSPFLPPSLLWFGHNAAFSITQRPSPDESQVIGVVNLFTQRQFTAH